jgi:hypothetical protein
MILEKYAETIQIKQEKNNFNYLMNRLKQNSTWILNQDMKIQTTTLPFTQN